MVGRDSGSAAYVVDTSSWISIETHPAQNRILSSLVPLIETGRIKVPKQVWDEFKDTSRLFAWLKPYRKLVLISLSTDIPYLQLAGSITHQFPAMAGARGRKEKADPWVIALALHNRTYSDEPIVVCNETVNNRANRKIPTACEHYGVECLNLLEMLDREYPADGWLLP